MEYEGLVVFSLVERFHLLFVVGRPEGGNCEGLRLAPREEGRPMRPREEPRLATDLPDILGRPSVDPFSRLEEGFSHEFFRDLFEGLPRLASFVMAIRKGTGVKAF